MAGDASASSPSTGDRSYCLVAPIFKNGVRRLNPNESYVLGRDKGIEIHLPERTVSRRHAQISWTEIGGGGFLIEDLDSVNGVRVGGDKVGQHFLHDGEVISIGGFGLRYRELRGDWSVLLEDVDDISSGDTKPLLAAFVPGSRLAGRFEGTELLEICQLVGQNQKTGKLEVTGEVVKGSMHFEEGKLVRADAARRRTDEEVRDVDAARTLLTLAEGSFEFKTGPVDAAGRRRAPQPVAIRGLLLELMRERDEAAAAPEDTPGFLLTDAAEDGADANESDWRHETHVDDEDD